MTTVDVPDPLEELRYALAQADAEPVPDGLGERVLLHALAGRVAGRAADPAPTITAAEGFRRTAAALAELLDTLSPEDWRTPALRDLDVQGVVGHLLAVERHFVSVLDGSGDVDYGVADHIAATDPVARAQLGRLPADTLADWRHAVAETLARVEHADAEALHETVTLHEVSLPLRSLLIVRAFEVWTHDDDIRRATGRPEASPELATLQLMTDLAVALVPAGMAKAGITSGEHRTARLVLTGPGGGTWQKHLGWGAAGPTDVRIIADAVTFCRLIANRVSADDFPATISGDATLARDILVGAASLALD